MKCRMKVQRIMFPKDRQIESGDFVIFVATPIKILEGTEELIVSEKYGTVSLKGNVPRIREGDIFNFTIGNPENNKYGTTYEVLGVSMDIDINNKKEVKTFFEQLCGKAVAKELMKLENPYKLFTEKNTEELLKVKGIGKAKLEKFYNSFDCFGDRSLAYAKLTPFGLTRQLINKMCNKLGGSVGAVDMCFNNPYGIIDKVDGIGFTKADEIAQKCGYTNINIRIKYAILHILETNGENGRSYLTAGQLVEEVNRLVVVDFSIIDTAIKTLIAESKVSLSSDGNMVALNKYIELENNIAIRLKELREAETHIKIPENWKEVVTSIEDKQGWKHTDEQLKGIETVLNNNVVIIRGLAGTGKSTVTNAMSEILDDYLIEMCCLSAKASQRLREVTGRSAQTIHKLLGLGMDSEKNEGNNVYADIVILDEASMVNGTIFLKLIQAIRKGSKLVILGDTGQLTAIGNCAVFSDMITSGVIPVVELTQIHRQAQRSAIISESRNIRNQKKIYDNSFRGHMVLGELQDLELFVEETNDNMMELIKNKFKADLNETKNVMEVQIITPTKTRGTICVNRINEEIQNIYNIAIGDYIEGQGDVRIFKGDKVINLKNNYSSKDIDGKNKPVWNGSIGKVIEIAEDYCIIDFVGIGDVVITKTDYKNINLGYAISCHSSQGSQWKKVICAFDMGAYMLLNVEILYTAITRASENCALIVEHKAMSLAIRKVEQNTKQTLLPMFIK